MLTSCYAKEASVFRAGRISISRSQGQYSYPVYNPLAPGSWFSEVEIPEYLERYQEQLDKLNPREVWADLHSIAQDDAQRKYRMSAEASKLVEPIILCFEKPGGTTANFCHRRLAATWLQDTLGVVIPEGTYDKKGNRITTPNFDTLCEIMPDGSFRKYTEQELTGQVSLFSL